jgi:hypothetical protein
VSICYLVLTHTDAPHVGKLARTLTRDGDSVVIHVDAAVDERPFADAVGTLPRVHLVRERTRVRWGGWSMVAATLALLQRAREVEPDASYYCLTSGDSYPVRPPDVVRSVLEGSGGAQYMNLLPMPSTVAKKPLTRVSHRWIEHDPRGNRLTPVLRAFHRVARRPYVARLEGLRLHCGSQWWALTRDCVDWVLAESAARTRFVALCRTSKVPDEHFFQTLVANSPFSATMRPSIMWTDWSTPPGPWPARVGASQIEALRALDGAAHPSFYGTSTVLLARKFTSASPSCAEVESVLWPLAVG